MRARGTSSRASSTPCAPRAQRARGGGGEIAALRARDAEREVELAALRAQGAARETELAALRARDAEREVELAALRARDAEHEAEMAALRSELDDAELDDALEDLDALYGEPGVLLAAAGAAAPADAAAPPAGGAAAAVPNNVAPSPPLRPARTINQLACDKLRKRISGVVKRRTGTGTPGWMASFVLKDVLGICGSPLNSDMVSDEIIFRLWEQRRAAMPAGVAAGGGGGGP